MQSVVLTHDTENSWSLVAPVLGLVTVDHDWPDAPAETGTRSSARANAQTEKKPTTRRRVTDWFFMYDSFQAIETLSDYRPDVLLVAR